MTNEQLTVLCDVIAKGFILLYSDKVTASRINAIENYKASCKEALKSLNKGKSLNKECNHECTTDDGE